MIIRIQRGGKSFKWLGTYLTHDAGKAQSSERVEWTDTLNLAHTHVGSAIDEMYWTYRAADQLKRAAGISTGGTRLQNPVKHLSLNWHPSDQPTREEMFAAVKDFVRHMGWQDHQAVLVAHNDRPHKHVHVMVNVVSPIDGRGLDAGYEWNRAEAWRVGYDRDRFRVLCEKSLKPYEQRDKTPTREAWLKFKTAEQEFDKAEAALAVRAPDYFDRHEPSQWKAKEWNVLRDYQKDQRTEFFAGGKQAYKDVRNAVFRGVRTEFRPEWRAYYAAKKQGVDPESHAEARGNILERQNAELETRRDAACADLREMRDADYRQILLEQKMQRAELTARQKDGLRTYDLLDRSDEPHDRDNREARREEDGDEQGSVRAQFGAAARETTEPERGTGRDSRDEREPEVDHEPAAERHRVRDPLDAAGLLGLGALGAIANVGERLFDGFFGGVPKKPPRQHADQPKPSADNRQARSTERQSRAEEQQADEAARLEAYWAERRRSRGRRDRD